ncbi:hypothetical protein CYMTET_17499 [Cymbomonas tetramitiformis]|uniref:Right handed beta helix domain-containing protein n=1 Tax=Cymbomonas tetramitiformis TaxID=36881 RepID=A0AAE0GBE1_9CHLO|nr:hypothetical protein CYMTET_17499 [Cymbomonas tetramitiformis]
MVKTRAAASSLDDDTQVLYAKLSVDNKNAHGISQRKQSASGAGLYTAHSPPQYMKGELNMKWSSPSHDFALTKLIGKEGFQRSDHDNSTTAWPPLKGRGTNRGNSSSKRSEGRALGEDDYSEGCTDVADWMDTDGSPCVQYEAAAWCTQSGGFGPSWGSEWGAFEEYAFQGHDASTACCACGGGNREGGEPNSVVDNCSDYPSWFDTDGFDCRTYEDNEYCTRTGEFGPGWLPDQYGPFSVYATNSVDATAACCACGGGNKWFPPPAPISSPPHPPAPPLQLAGSSLTISDPIYGPAYLDAAIAAPAIQTVRLEAAMHLPSPLQPISRKLLIAGSCTSDGGCVVDAAGQFRVFVVTHGGELELRGLILLRGSSSLGASAEHRLGGGLYVEGNGVARLRNCTIEACTAEKGGGIFVGAPSEEEQCLYSQSCTQGAAPTLDLEDCWISGNVGVEGGGIHVSGGTFVSVSNSVLSDNRSPNGKGGALQARGQLTTVNLDRVAVSDNSADEGRGAVLGVNADCDDA